MPDLVLGLAKNTSLSELARGLATKESGKPAAYVCKNNSCNLPVHDPDELAALLSKRTQ